MCPGVPWCTHPHLCQYLCRLIAVTCTASCGLIVLARVLCTCNHLHTHPLRSSPPPPRRVLQVPDRPPGGGLPGGQLGGARPLGAGGPHSGGLRLGACAGRRGRGGPPQPAVRHGAIQCAGGAEAGCGAWHVCALLFFVLLVRVAGHRSCSVACSCVCVPMCQPCCACGFPSVAVGCVSLVRVARVGAVCMPCGLVCVWPVVLSSRRPAGHLGACHEMSEVCVSVLVGCCNNLHTSGGG